MSFNTNDVMYNLKILGYSFLNVKRFEVTIKSFLFSLMLLKLPPSPERPIQAE